MSNSETRNVKEVLLVAEPQYKFNNKVTWKTYNYPNVILGFYFASTKKKKNHLMLNLIKTERRALHLFPSPLRLQFCHNQPPEINVQMPLIGKMAWDDFINLSGYFSEYILNHQ